MVLVYQANPHQKVALDFPEDDWLRFMHNTHTPAPYGYGWTATSLLPSELGLGKFLSTWLVFRAWEVLGLVGLTGVLFLLRRDRTLEALGTPRSAAITVAELGLTLLHPLLLIEVVSNAHNDLWMMVPVLFSLWLVTQRKSRALWLAAMIASIALLGYSISIKFASVLLFPIWAWLVLRPWLRSQENWLRKSMLWKPAELIDQHLPELASLAMLLPLLTLRSQQFHPWYFTWILVFLPFMTLKWWRRSLLVLSFSSLLRYVPWLLAGNFDGDVLPHQKMITWIPFIIFLTISLFLELKRQLAAKSVE
jgi:hypothetical protein